MEKFIEFDPTVNLEDLKQALANHNPGIMILRLSKLTGTVKIKIDDALTKKDLKEAFQPFKIKKIYDDFPVKRYQ
jgi:hypothetical protein